MPKGEKKAGGRPPKPAIEYSNEFKSGLNKALKAKEKQTGRSFYDLLVDMAYGVDADNDNCRLGAMKIIRDTFAVKESKTETHKFTHGVVELPAMSEDPADADATDTTPVIQ